MRAPKSVLVLVFLFVIFTSFAQVPAPAWLSQIKLSGVNGTPDQKLATINGKNFAAGEAYDLKLKGRTVRVQCLEIQDQSALVKIQDLPTPYALTLAGESIPIGTAPTPVATAPATVAEPPKPAPAPLAPALIFSQPVFHPPAMVQPLSVSIGHFLMWVFLAFIFGLALGAGAARFRFRKNLGEALLAATIDKYFSRPHLLLNNVTLATPEGTTQIDHVLVADTGIFVIETKHYTGWIFGDPKGRQWTQQIYRHKSRFQNPLNQNYGHIKTLQSLFDLSAEHFHSLVVFTGDAEFKTDLGPNVIRLGNLIPFLTADRPILYDERKMTYIVGRIEMKRERRSLETDEYHINHVRSRLPGQAVKPNSRSAFSPPAGNPFASGSGDEKYQPKG
ncbi:MAG: nuclease-related domain-containing protein [Verrucomicrobiota bacterium]